MKRWLLVMLMGCSCLTPRMTPALRVAMRKVVPQQDTICFSDEFDWRFSDSAYHVHCIHDKTKYP
jgi:hypothetical protein